MSQRTEDKNSPFDVVKAYSEELKAVWLTRNKGHARITQFIPSEGDHEDALRALEMRIRAERVPPPAATGATLDGRIPELEATRVNSSYR